MVGSRVLYALLYAKAVLRQLALSCHIIKAVCFLEFGLGLAYFLYCENRFIKTNDCEVFNPISDDSSIS